MSSLPEVFLQETEVTKKMSVYNHTQETGCMIVVSIK